MPHIRTTFIRLLVAGSLWCAADTPLWSQPFNFTTLAGNAGYGTADGAGTDARFDFPQGVAVDVAGNVFVADTQNSTLRRIDANGTVSTPAGLAGATGHADGTGSAARFYYPQGMAVDGAGNIYVADTANSKIRLVTPAGVVSTLACITNNASGSNNAASFNLPGALAADTSGVLYLADTFNHTIRMVVPSGSNWVVTTLAGMANVSTNLNGTNNAAGFSQPSGIAVDSGRNLYVADTGNNLVRKLTPTGTNWVTTTIAAINSPRGIVVDGATNLYVAASAQNLIQKISRSGTNWIVSTLAGRAGVAGSDDGTTTNALFNYPCGIALATNGVLYVADALNNTIRKITAGGGVSTLAGQAGGAGSADDSESRARFDAPLGLAVDAGRNLFVADSGNNVIRRITPDGGASTVAGAATNLPGSADGIGTTVSFNLPAAVAVDRRTNIYVADCLNNEIRMMSPAGAAWTTTTLAGHANAAFMGLVTNFVGMITNVVGNTNLISPAFSGSSQFTNYSGLVTNINGKTTNVFVVVTNTPFYTNVSVINRTTTTNIVSLATNVFPLPIFSSSMVFYYKASFVNYSGFLTNIANIVLDAVTNAVTNITIVVTNLPAMSVTNIIHGTNALVSVPLTPVFFELQTAPRLLDGPCAYSLFYHPTGLAVDDADTLYVADGGTNGVRLIAGGASVTTLPGSQGAYVVGASLRAYHSSSVAVDGAGNVYVADAFNNTIRKIAPGGAVTTLAGSPGLYGTADGAYTNARFASPVSLALDAMTNLLVADASSHTLRKVTNYGTNWVVATIGGWAGVAGSADGLGTAARFNNPGGIAVDSSGNLYVADTDNNTIRIGAVLDAGPVYLQIKLVAQQIVLSWPASSSGFQLEQSTAPGGSWQPVTNPPALSETEATVTNDVAGAALFFRLHKP